jgi:hypothetical protein
LYRYLASKFGSVAAGSVTGEKEGVLDVGCTDSRVYSRVRANSAGKNSLVFSITSFPAHQIQGLDTNHYHRDLATNLEVKERRVYIITMHYPTNIGTGFAFSLSASLLDFSNSDMIGF